MDNTTPTPQSKLQAELPPPETETVTTTRVACDGGEGALGHPRVWLSIDPKRGWVDCGYCDKRYILAEGAGGGDH